MVRAFCRLRVCIDDIFWLPDLVRHGYRRQLFSGTGWEPLDLRTELVAGQRQTIRIDRFWHGSQRPGGGGPHNSVRVQGSARLHTGTAEQLRRYPCRTRSGSQDIVDGKRGVYKARTIFSGRVRNAGMPLLSLSLSARHRRRFGPYAESVNEHWLPGREHW